MAGPSPPAGLSHVSAFLADMLQQTISMEAVMMNFRLATASLALTLACAGQAGAISRIRADQNSCATLQQTLEREDAAVIRWALRPHGGLFSL